MYEMCGDCKEIIEERDVAKNWLESVVFEKKVVGKRHKTVFGTVVVMLYLLQTTHPYHVLIVPQTRESRTR